MKVLGLSHVLLCSTNLAESRAFYVDVLGFEVLEEDPEHGGVFLAIPGGTHVVDLVPIEAPRPPKPIIDPDYAPRPGVGHLALHVESPEALRDAYFELIERGVTVLFAADHKSQQSVYFLDPDNNMLELCWERPNARELYLSGRGDDDAVLTFTRG
jgi:catechol 2,3-dioxygenase-like lactoylglutathione lyase family enzyme